MSVAVVVLAVAVALLVLSARLPDPDWQRYAQMAAGVVGVLGLLLLLAPGSAGRRPRSW